MMAEGYKTSPLSDELERRIRERIVMLRAQKDRRQVAVLSGEDIGCASLEWVLREAEAIKAEGLKPAVSVGPRMIRQEQPRNWNACPRCGHVHHEGTECGEQLGGGRVCRCEESVTA